MGGGVHSYYNFQIFKRTPKNACQSHELPKRILAVFILYYSYFKPGEKSLVYDHACEFYCSEISSGFPEELHDKCPLSQSLGGSPLFDLRSVYI